MKLSSCVRGQLLLASPQYDYVYLELEVFHQTGLVGVVGYHVSLTPVSSLKVSSSSLGRIICFAAAECCPVSGEIFLGRFTVLEMLRLVVGVA